MGLLTWWTAVRVLASAKLLVFYTYGAFMVHPANLKIARSLPIDCKNPYKNQKINKGFVELVTNHNLIDPWFRDKKYSLDHAVISLRITFLADHDYIVNTTNKEVKFRWSLTEQEITAALNSDDYSKCNWLMQQIRTCECKWRKYQNHPRPFKG